MFGELTNIDISSYSRPELEALIRQTLPVVEIHTKAMQRLLSISGGRPGNFNTGYPTQDFTEPATIAIANGKKLTGQELQDIDEDKFDIILDMTSNSLRFRNAPSKHTALKEAPHKNIGELKIRMLAYLLEHPDRLISIKNASIFYKPNAENTTSNALAKNINILRKALDQKGKHGPYIITERLMGNTHHDYKINTKWSYLVIKEQKI